MDSLMTSRSVAQTDERDDDEDKVLATDCNRLQQTATDCNSLKHTTTHRNTIPDGLPYHITECCSD